MPQNKRFTVDEIEYLKTNYSTMSVEKLASHLDRSPRSVRDKIERLGLRLMNLERNQPRNWTESELEFMRLNYLCFSDTELGKRFNCSPSLVFRKRKELGLKKPHHEPYIAAQYVRQHIDGRNVLLHRYMMEQCIGRELTKEEKVHHIDGDKLNYSINNLYLCKDRSEHAYVHDSLEKVAFQLVKTGIIKFNSDTGRYYL